MHLGTVWLSKIHILHIVLKAVPLLSMLHVTSDSEASATRLRDRFPQPLMDSSYTESTNARYNSWMSNLHYTLKKAK